MLKIKDASVSDIKTIQDIAQKAFPHTYAAILSKQQIDYMMDMMYSSENILAQMRAGHLYRIGFVDDVACAYTSLEPCGNSVFHLQKIYILPDFQGKGLGRSMILDAFAIAKALSKNSGKCRVELNVNRSNKAMGFYKKMGLEIASQGDFDIGNGYFMNDYIMAIDL